MNNSVRALVVGLCVAVSGGLALAGDWTPLGDRILTYRSTEESVMVKSDAAFKLVKLQVKGNALEIEKAVVTFKDGTTFEAAVNAYVAPGSSTKELALPSAKAIEKVTFSFKKPGSTNKLATVRVLAAS